MADIRESLIGVEGWLSDREAQFLAMLAACPTCEGTILELGSYRGRSAIAFAKGAALADCATVHTVDILPPDILKQNLCRAKVRNGVEVYHQSSQQVLDKWREPLRLFWHDGANDYDMVVQDLERGLEFIADRGMLAFHDVLNTSGARVWVFVERILSNPHIAEVGICGSIGWAQYRSNPADAAAYAGKKKRLHDGLKALYPYHEKLMGHRGSWAQKASYKIRRWRIPHGRVDPRKWVRKVA